MIQLAGTLFFNLSTFHALQTSLSTGQEDRLIWRPDAFGSICFLVASTLAWVEVCGVAIRGPRRQLEWWIVAVNLAGSVAFGISAVAGYVVPATGDDLDLAAANVTTSVGALFFLAGAVLLLIEGARARVAAIVPWRPHDPHVLTALADRPAVDRGAGGRRHQGRLRPDLAQGAEEARRRLEEHKLTLQLGLVANQSGLQKAVKAASNPASSSYGKYPSLSTLASKYGASSSKRKGVVNAFKKQSVKATVDVTHLRVTATVSIGKAQKLFGTKWAVYKAKSGAHVALPVNTPKLPKGIKGNVDTVAGTRLQLTKRIRERRRRRHADPHRLAGPRLHAGQLSQPRPCRPAGCSRTRS